MSEVRSYLLGALNILMEHAAAAPFSTEAVRYARLAVAVDDILNDLEEL